jgi:hypothetical protein
MGTTLQPPEKEDDHYISQNRMKAFVEFTIIDFFRGYKYGQK